MGFQRVCGRAGQVSFNEIPLKRHISHDAGKILNALNGVSDFEVQVSGTPDPKVGSSETRSVGSVISTKPTVQAVVDLSENEFRALQAMAVAQRLAACRICFDKPHYGKAPILSVSFSTRNDPDDL